MSNPAKSAGSNLAGLFGRSPWVGFITTPDEGQFQARITRQGRPRSRLFSVSKYDGDHAEAWNAACDWLESLGGAFRRQPRRLRRQTQSNRQSSGHVGVYRREVHDRRRDCIYLRFDVIWHESSGKQRSRSFSAGRLDVADQAMADCAYHAAEDFRKAYEAACRQGSPFDPPGWRDWRVQYGFDRLTGLT